MGAKYLIDTNVAIEWIGGTLPKESSKRLQQLADQQLLAMSVINRIELLGYPGPAEVMSVVEAFTASIHILPLDEPSADATISLRRTVKIKLPDANCRIGARRGIKTDYTQHRRFQSGHRTYSD